MAIERNGVVLKQLRTLFSAGTTRDLTDGQLLERFATDRGEAAEQAFSALVERHGPMVQRALPWCFDRPPRHAGCVPGHVPGPGQTRTDALGAGFLGPVAPSSGLPNGLVRAPIGGCAVVAGTNGVRHRWQRTFTPRLETSWVGCCMKKSNGSPSIPGAVGAVRP